MVFFISSNLVFPGWVRRSGYLVGQRRGEDRGLGGWRTSPGARLAEVDISFRWKQHVKHEVNAARIYLLAAHMMPLGLTSRSPVRPPTIRRWSKAPARYLQHVADFAYVRTHIATSSLRSLVSLLQDRVRQRRLPPPRPPRPDGAPRDDRVPAPSGRLPGVREEARRRGPAAARGEGVREKE